MTTEEPAGPRQRRRRQQRRRGERLEAELLTAGWDELTETGYARLTMESVAARARTGSAVLYRRWANKDELVLAAIEHHRGAHPVADADTGTLRGDLLAQLTAVSEALAGFFAIAVAAVFSGLMADTGLTPAQVRDRVLDARRPAPVRSLYQRAHDRGEIDLGRLPAAVLELPFDLVRHDLLLDLAPLKPARVRSIVDELFLPLLRTYQAQLTVKELTFDGSETRVLRSILAAQRRVAGEWARSRDLTFEQAVVLEHLQRRPGAIQRDLADLTRTTAANVSVLLKGLERRGLVERRIEAGDERSKRVRLTPAGSSLIDGFESALAEADRAVFAPLSGVEQSGLRDLLRKVAAPSPERG
ncbi:TetR/AcrR family transcriptional regulator C-terminal ligand-binding domain-containing protein [Amycolatopsis sp. PS_44_ISF1]|uniref:TetR/AcrR family transcriptional regulator C-terminal ligand-binding domain-containing protein n=1 Tax=Amycolatopsis sp. PS_44_ISF1 TaxID=2974917 RepID=UPI0028DFF8A5|nr:TetR/AcrR family transcriptional regulator C-terminal ligand-binding domain-containing protein [Amycolatopsis sp. PS_44_ISF1]MDT8913162.1 TetR/AcrR family transcriptional regulator C-terminal ligand-binding domain-containing protein [Amycolatopsis sp. PS_44_ISF1]